MELIRDHQLDIMLALSSVCFIILVFVIMTNFLSKEKKKALIIYTFSAAFLLLTDRYAYIYKGQTTDIAYILAPLCKYLVFFNILNISYGFNEFLICIYKENHNSQHASKLFDLVKVIVIIGHILLIVSNFTNFYYSFDGLNVYRRESGYVICYLFPIIATIIQFIIILKDYKKTNRRLIIPLFLYCTLPVIASIMQLFTSGVSLANILIGGVSVLLYSFAIYDANMMVKEKEKTEADLRLANEIQQNEIPNEFPAFPDRNEFDLYAMMSPAKEVGGDYYDYFLVDNNHLAMVIADVSGKGIPAALNMMKVKILLRSLVLKQHDPSKVLAALNDSFVDNNKLDMFVTIWFGIVEISSGILTYANAGHEDLILYKKDSGYDLLKTKHGLPIGAKSNNEYENYIIKLDRGNKIFLYTDGITEAIDTNIKPFGINNLLKSLNKHRNEDVENTIKLVKKDIMSFTDSSNQFDDITMLCFELKNNNSSIHLRRKFKASEEEINNVYNYFTDSLKEVLSLEKIKKYYIVLDELFSNIVKYGYKDIDDEREKYISIDLKIDTMNKKIIVTFEDNGVEFNPLENEDPNINLSTEERNEGGLGIYIVKKMVNKVSYKYIDNKNYLILEIKY